VLAFACSAIAQTASQCTGLSISATKVATFFQPGRYHVPTDVYTINIVNNGPYTYSTWGDNAIVFDIVNFIGGGPVGPTSFAGLYGLQLVNYTGDLGQGNVRFQVQISYGYEAPTGFFPGSNLHNYLGFLVTDESSSNQLAFVSCPVIGGPATSTTGLSASSTTAVSSTTGASSTSCSSISITQTLSNSWNSGSQWTVTIANTGSKAVSAVNLLAALPAQISQLWGLTDASNGHYTLPSYTQAIAVGGSIQFGYISTNTNQVSFSLSSETCQ